MYFKKLFSCLALLSILHAFSPLGAQMPAYSLVKVKADRAELMALSAQGLLADHGSLEADGYTAAYSQGELQELQVLGVSYEVLQADLQAFYAARLDSEPAAARSAGTTATTPTAFNYGSMGGYLTFDEVLAELDSMAMAYPGLVTVRDSIGVSHEGRALWMVKLSDNPNVDENEPEVLYCSLHHSREPMSMVNLIYYMQYLLENYGTDPTATFLLDNRELYFVPVVNPDGYVYNQTIAPNGGGMWRKNRRVNGGGEFGVDLNRNYGYEWGHDNSGSSPDPASDLYRGPGAFSEPESQAMRDFCIARDFKTGFSYHSYGNLLIRPWGYDASAPLADLPLFNEYGQILTEANNYYPGNVLQTVGYDANGVTDDWMYGEQVLKDKMITFTPEVGNASDGFWPPQSRILPLCEENLEANIRLALLAGDYINATPLVPEDFAGPSVDLPVDFKNLGLSNSGPFTAEFTTSDPNILGVSGPLNLSALGQGATTQGSFTLSLASGIPNGTLLCGVLQTTFAGGVTEVDTVCMEYGIRQIAFQDSVDNQPFQWTGGWNTTTEKAYSGTMSITDSPFSDYFPNTNSVLQVIGPIDLSNMSLPILQFQAQWEIETGWDYCQVSASSDGSTWTPLEGDLTINATGPTQPSGTPIYHNQQTTWAAERMELDAYAGGMLYLRFTLVSDQVFELDGFYFDDLVVKGFSTLTQVEGQSLAGNPFLYPNPSRGQLKVGGSAALEESSLEIADIRGRVLLRRTVTPGAVIDAADLPAGIYLYHFEAEGRRSQVRKLILE